MWKIPKLILSCNLTLFDKLSLCPPPLQVQDQLRLRLKNWNNPKVWKKMIDRYIFEIPDVLQLPERFDEEARTQTLPLLSTLKMMQARFWMPSCSKKI